MENLQRLEAEMGHFKNIREINQSKKESLKFNIGDEVGLYFGGGTLVGFVESIGDDGVIQCRNKFKDGNGFRGDWLPELGGLYHIRRDKPMFKTDDDVMLYEGDVFYWVTDDGCIIEKIAAPSNDAGHPDYRQFSTKEIAEEYVKKRYKASSLNKKFSMPVKKTIFQRLFGTK